MFAQDAVCIIGARLLPYLVKHCKICIVEVDVRSVAMDQDGSPNFQRCNNIAGALNFEALSFFKVAAHVKDLLHDLPVLR